MPSIFKRSAYKSFIATFILLTGVYLSWLIVFWPGALGEDSLAILLEVESGGKTPSGKPAFWYFFVKTLYQPLSLIEIPIGFQLLFSATIFSRILAWCWEQNFRKIFFFLLFFICLAPHTILYAGALYPDAIFSIALSGLIFELWLITQRQHINLTSLLIISLTFPFAVFARSNGIIFAALTLIALFFIRKPEKIKLATISIAWLIIATIANKAHHTHKHETLFPLALFETVNFLQPRPMGLWTESPRVSERSIQALTQSQSLEKILENYDRDYWDPLIFKPDGPQLNTLSKSERKILVKEFFTYNLWRNIPAFISSRINIFLVAALAQGGTQSHDYTIHVMEKTASRSNYRPFNAPIIEKAFRSTYATSYYWRTLLWTPFLGIALIVISTRKSIKQNAAYLTLINITLIVQLGAIFTFSIAGEYRYLLPFFILPIAMLPIYHAHQRLK